MRQGDFLAELKGASALLATMPKFEKFHTLGEDYLRARDSTGCYDISVIFESYGHLNGFIRFTNLQTGAGRDYEFRRITSTQKEALLKFYTDLK